MGVFIETLKLRNETMFYFGLVNLVVAIIFLLLTRTSSTQLGGVSAWYKPFKFAASTFLYAWAMAWYCYYLPSFNVTAFNWAIIIFLGFEVVYIAIQAGRGQLSHYNVSTPTYSALFSLMALAATGATLYTAYVCALFFQHDFPELPNYYVLGIRLGLLIFVVFSFEGFAMGSRMAHTVGALDGSPGLPIVNWSKSHGDLRIAHFIGMHALQVLPILSFYVIKNVRGTVLVASLYGLLSFFVLYQALQGKPLFRFFTHHNEI
jgi:hypothetical protein